MESTEQFFRTDEGYPVRLWKGHTGQGTPVVVFVSAVAAPEGADTSELEAELKEIPGPRPPDVALRDLPEGQA